MLIAMSTKKVKLKWKVAGAPSGLYRSFQRRRWPTAYYPDGRVAASFSCEDDYVPSLVRQGKHGPLTVLIADHSSKPWRWRKAKVTAPTLAEAKSIVLHILERNPAMMGEA